MLPQFVEWIDDLLGYSAGVLFLPFGKGESAIGLKITMRRVGYPHLRVETTLRQTKLGCGGPERGVEVGGDVERKVHQWIEELRLALSKKDFRGFTVVGVDPVQEA